MHGGQSESASEREKVCVCVRERGVAGVRETFWERKHGRDWSSCRETTQGSSWGYLKSQFPADLSTFGDNSPEKRPKGSKNVHRIPPLRGFCGLDSYHGVFPRFEAKYVKRAK